MAKVFTAEAVTEEPFLFVSYSHENKSLTAQMATYLLDEGVRLWYDKDLAAGDPWPEIVEKLITHTNCRGIIFVCSPDAYLSKNVHKERKLALDIQKARGADKYPFFFVNVCDDIASGAYMNLLKATFDRESQQTIAKTFPIETLHTLISMIGLDPLCIMTAQEDWCSHLLNDGIRRRAADTVDKGHVALENLQQAAGFGNVSVVLGNYNGPLEWQLISREEDCGVFLLNRLLTNAYGEGLEQWLNQTFRPGAFTEEESQLIQGTLRLLTIQEAKQLTESVLRADNPWWLQDCTGSRQAEVKAEGIVSALRQINHRFQRGVRPVLVLKLEDVNCLINKK